MRESAKAEMLGRSFPTQCHLFVMEMKLQAILKADQGKPSATKMDEFSEIFQKVIDFPSRPSFWQNKLQIYGTRLILAKWAK